MNKKNTKESNKKGILLEFKPIYIIGIIIFIAIMALIFSKLQQNVHKSNREVSPEILRSRSYDVVNDGDEATNSEYVKFDAFFLKDIDLDGNADAIRGSCNEVGKEDTLYMDLKVINNGYFKNGKITINSNNFYLNTSIVKDNIVKANYISNNTKTINLNEMQNGAQKLLTGIVRSGNYSSIYSKTDAIGNDTTKYSKINNITFTGIHVDDNGRETQVSKTINFTVDWYGTTKANISLKNVTNNVNSFDELLNGENMVLDFTIKTAETDNELILKKSYLEGVIPELNGYKPKSVEFNGERLTSTYNQETGEFTVQKEATIDTDQIVTEIVNTSSSSSNRYNKYNVKVIYPREAYENMENNSIQLLIPVKTYYEGYNNPNSEFTNPYVSNTAETTIVARWVKYEGFEYRFDIIVGKHVSKPYPRYVVSKEKPIKIFNNISATEKNDYYNVRWTLATGENSTSTGITMKETKEGNVQAHDSFIKTDSTKETMEELTANVGIYFTGADGLLGDNGWIKVYDDTTNELINTFSKNDWNNYSESNPYRYGKAIKHIRVETSETNSNAYFIVYNLKELDDKYITENYTKENFDTLKYINSNLAGTYGTNTNTVTHSAYYEAPLSVASINISTPTFSTQGTTKNQIITLKTETDQYNEQKWKNGTFLVKLPAEIINMEINSVTTNNNKVSILGYDLYEQGDNYYIKVLTENNDEETYNIKIDCNMTPDPRSTTVTRDIELYAINEQGADYYYKGNDIYDIDGDLNTEEILNYNTVTLNLISPNELLTNQIGTNYDDKNSITISPCVAKVEKNQRTAEINVNVTNNYAQDITDLILQGVIPFEGNQFIVGNTDLGSQFTTYINNNGIEVPDELKNYATVYYSTKEKPSNDISNPDNDFKTADEVTDWNSIKTYVISLGDYILHSGEKHTFKYKVNIPEDVNYNEVTYSDHAIFFALMTDEGKYNTYTASDKLGFMIAKQYDLEIEKLQENSDKKLQGVTFKITEEGKSDSKIKVTNNEGKINISGLYAEKTYIIKELKTTSDYILNEEEIKIYTYVDEQDRLYVTYKDENGTYSDLTEKYSWLKDAEVKKEENQDYKIKLSLENEVKPRLKIKKVSSKTGESLSNVMFSVTGRDFEQRNNTNANGELEIKGLYLNEEYQITEENRKEGYYLIEPIKFKITNNNGVYSVQILEGNVKQSTVTTNDYIPQAELTIENENIPTYNLKVIKIDESSKEEKVLPNSEFILSGEDDNSQKKLDTNQNGETQTVELYQYVEGKPITGKYTLKETKAPNGYANNKEEINFVVKNNNNNLEVNIENSENLTSLKKAEIENNTLKLTIQDKPLFKIVKTDEATGDPLENVKFSIYELEEDGTEVDFAKDVNGNYVGTQNEKGKYELITDANGIITIPLRNGTYKAIEVEAPEGYQKSNREEIFKISGNEEEQEAGTPDEFTDLEEINYIEDLITLSENVNNGNSYSNTKFVLKRTLDFEDSNSYRDPNDITTYGDYNGDGVVENIKTELTTGIGFKGIGASTPFCGIFDGQGNEINGIHIDKTSENTALFGYVANGKVKRLGVGGNITSRTNTASTNTAGLIAKGDNIEIYNCYNNCKIVGQVNTAGILGCGTGKITIENCYNNGIIQANSYSAGIIGRFENGDSIDIKNSYNNAHLVLRDESGGILGGGYSGTSINIENCNNYGVLNTSGNGGGIVGFISDFNELQIKDCTNFGNIDTSQGQGVGGIFGYTSNLTTASFYNCTNYGDLIASTNQSFGFAGGIAGFLVKPCTFKYCFNYGNLITNGTYNGGILGCDYQGALIEACGNYGDIKGYGGIGGIYGNNYTNNGLIVDSFNKGNIYIAYSGASGITAGNLSVQNTYNMRKDLQYQRKCFKCSYNCTE